MKQSQLKTLKGEIINLAKEFGPIGVRGLYYQAVCAGVLDKTESDYNLLQRQVTQLRISGDIGWDLITDCSRNVQTVSTWDNIQEIIDTATRQFKLDIWKDQECRVQIWLEKEGLAPLLEDIIERFRVPIYPSKGFSSLSFTRKAALEAVEWLEAGQKVFVLQFGDYDPSGVCIAESLENQYTLFGAGKVEMRRVGLNKEHIEQFNLNTRETKNSDTRHKNFGDDRSVELDAIPPKQFKAWVTSEIQQYIDWSRWNDSLKEEETQRATIIRNN